MLIIVSAKLAEEEEHKPKGHAKEEKPESILDIKE
jgi:hypothetical protein